ETYHDSRRHPLPHRRARRGTALRPLLPAASGAAVPAAADRLRRAGDARRAAVRTVGGYRRPAPRRGPGRDPRPHARGLADPLDAVPADRLLDDPAAGLRGDRPVLDRGPAHARRHEHARGLPGGLAGLVRDPPGARRGAGIPRQRRGDLVGVPAGSDPFAMLLTAPSPQRPTLVPFLMLALGIAASVLTRSMDRQSAELTASLE